jgi:hypothetical protein
MKTLVLGILRITAKLLLDIEFDDLLASTPIYFDKTFCYTTVQYSCCPLTRDAQTTSFRFQGQILLDLVQRQGILRSR